jgi:hypothetical protein
MKDIDKLRAHIRELQENGDRLREIADAAVRDQRDMIEAVAGPLRAEIIRLRDALHEVFVRWLDDADPRELPHVVEQARAALASNSAPGIDTSAGCVEPVAWMKPEGELGFPDVVTERFRARAPLSCQHCTIPLYAAPQQRQPLSEVEIATLRDGAMRWNAMQGCNTLDALDFARAVEAAHGIKETK